MKTHETKCQIPAIYVVTSTADNGNHAYAEFDSEDIMHKINRF